MTDLSNSFIPKLKSSLSQPLPGMSAQRTMSPGKRRQYEPTVLYDQAAVLIALYQENDRYYFPLIHRTKDEYVHSGQVALPGGRIEPDESIIEAALREANEEIGLDSKQVEVIGELSHLPIPISRFMVYPVVGVVSGVPDLKSNPDEVQTILITSVDQLLNPISMKEETWMLSGRSQQVPFFYLNEMKVWGATAMILSELKEIIVGTI